MNIGKYILIFLILAVFGGGLLLSVFQRYGATVLSVPQGGTGIGSYVAGDILMASAANALTRVGIGAAGTVLTSNGSLPAWAVNSVTSTWYGPLNWSNATGTNATTTSLYVSGLANLTLLNIASNITVGGTNPKRTMVLTGAGALQSSTAGATSTQWESTTNKQNTWAPEFASTTANYVEWTTVMPSSYDGGTMTAVFYWMTTSSAATYATWGIQAVAYGDSDTFDASWGTAVTTTDANQANTDVNISAASAAFTIAGTPAGDKMVQFRVYRDKSATGGDTLGAVARLVGVRIEYGVSTFSD